MRAGEKVMSETGRAAYLERLASLRARGAMAWSDPGLRIRAAIAGPLRQRILQAVREGTFGPKDTTRAEWVRILIPVLRHAGARMCGQITAEVSISCALDGMSERDASERIATRLAYAVEERDWKREHADYWSYLKRGRKRNGSDWYLAKMRSALKLNPVPRPDWSMRERISVGMGLMLLLQEAVPMISTKMKVDTEKHMGFSRVTRRRLLQLDPALLEWVGEASTAGEYARPFLMPSEDAPLDWALDGEGGGFESTLLRRQKLLPPRSSKAAAPTPNADPARVASVCNILQRTRWSTNLRLMEVMRSFRIEGLPGVLPAMEDPDPPNKPPTMKSGHAWDAYARRKALWGRMVHQNKRKRDRMRRAVQAAELLKGVEAYQFCTFADARGRIYYEGSGFQPQSCDIGKACLLFAESEPVDAGWLGVSTANHWGIKGTTAERLAWVRENEDNIARSGEDGRRFRWWTDASDPWKFLAHCQELARPTGKLPIQLDATTSGLQIMSLCLRSEAMARRTNVVGSGRQDIYIEVAKVVEGRLLEAAQCDDEKTREYASSWLGALGGSVPRGAVKATVMSVPMAKTAVGAADSARDLADEIEDSGVRYWRLKSKDMACRWFGKLVHKAAGEVLPEAMGMLDWLKEIARDSAKEQKPIRWTTPTGIEIELAAQSWSRKYIRLGRHRKGAYREFTGKISTKRQTTGLASNFIQSLDAALLCRIIELMDEAGAAAQIAVIHDCAMISPRHGGVLLNAVHQAYGELVAWQPLERFREDVERATGMSFRPPPTIDTLEQQSVNGDSIWT